MTDHYPDCIYEDIDESRPGWRYCICNRIRSHEIRLINRQCVWGEGECVNGCPSCKRMDELIAERAAGFKEGVKAARDAVAVYYPDTITTETGQGYEYALRQALAAIEALKGSDDANR